MQPGVVTSGTSDPDPWRGRSGRAVPIGDHGEGAQRFDLRPERHHQRFHARRPAGRPDPAGRPVRQTTLLMEGSGGDQPATNLDVTFDDEASPIPDDAFTSGRSQPTAAVPDGFRDKTGKAPSPPHGLTLSEFDGRDPTAPGSSSCSNPTPGASGAIIERVDARLRARRCRPAGGRDGRWAGDGTRRGRIAGRERVLERRGDPDPVGRLGDAVPLDDRGLEPRRGRHGRERHAERVRGRLPAGRRSPAGRAGRPVRPADGGRRGSGRRRRPRGHVRRRRVRAHRGGPDHLGHVPAVVQRRRRVRVQRPAARRAATPRFGARGAERHGPERDLVAVRVRGLGRPNGSDLGRLEPGPGDRHPGRDGLQRRLLAHGLGVGRVRRVGDLRHCTATVSTPSASREGSRRPRS